MKESRKSAKLRCQKLLQHPGKISVQSQDGAFLMQLLQRHHHAAQKMGCGISHFSVECSSVGGFKPSSHFVLHCDDGSSTDFSYNKCINSRPAPAAAPAAAPAVSSSVDDSSSTSTSTLQNMPMGSSRSSRGMLHDQFRYEALRKAVYGQTQAVKTAALCGRGTGAASNSQPGRVRAAPVCPVTGAKLTWDNAQVHHAGRFTFRQLMQGWLQQQGITLSEVGMTTGDNTVGSTMADDSQKLSWWRYHRQHAVLELVSKEGHTQLTEQQNRQRSNLPTTSPVGSSSGSSNSSSSAGRRAAAAAAPAPAGSVDEVAAQLAQLTVQRR